MHSGAPILLLEDDVQDIELLQGAFKSIGLKREAIFFTNGKDLINYLLTASGKPFLILSDINMPGMNGLDTREAIYQNTDIELAGVPYIFFSTSESKTAVEKILSSPFFGYFVKPMLYEDLIKTTKKIIDYWEAGSCT